MKAVGDSKYTFNYVPSKTIPAGLMAYMGMVIKRDPWLWVFLIVTDIIHSLRYPASYFLMGLIIDLLESHPMGAPVPQEVWTYTWLMFAVLFIGEMCHLLPHYVTFNWMERIRPALRSDLMSYTLDHSFTYFQDHFAGSLARKISEGVEKIPNLSTQIRWEIMLPLVGMTSSAALLLKVSWMYGALVFVFLGIIVLPVFLKLKKLRDKSQEFSDVRSSVSGQIVDTLSNIATVKSFAHEEVEMAAHKKISETEMKAWHKMLRVFLMLDNYRRMTLVLFGGGMMAACIVGWQRELITLGEIATIMGIAFSFTASAWNMSFGIIHVSESLGYLNDSLQTLIKPHFVEDREGASEMKVKKGKIAFKNVTFNYSGQPVFQNLSVIIAPHQRIGLIGPSGAGKSTFISLIQRFFDIQKGSISIDGQDISAVTQNSLRLQIAVIPQDTSLFHRSLMENIRYGRLDASDEEVIEAAKKAYAHDFITRLPLAYETLVGERGIKLSGGQRQRIAIARAILKNAPILILDEATSALDSESERLIKKSLEELMKEKTVIAIAHRLSTISHLDRLLVMQQGTIVEDGSHDELIEQGGLYARLWKMQSGGFLKD